MPQKAVVMVTVCLMPKMTTTAPVLVHEVTWPTEYNVTVQKYYKAYIRKTTF